MLLCCWKPERPPGSGVSDAESALLDGDLDSDPRIFGAQRRRLRGSVRGMVADLAPAKAKAKEDEGGGRGLEADELGSRVSRRGPVSLGVCRGRSPGDRMRRPKERSISRVEPSGPRWGGCP